MVDDSFNIFGDIFGENSKFNEMFGNLGKKGQDPEKIRLEALIRTFQQEVDKGDKTFLKDAVIKYKVDVEELDSPRLYKEHAMAAIFIDNFPLGYSSFKKYVEKTDNPAPTMTEALGLLAYQTKHFQEALELLGDDTICEEATLVSICAHYETGDVRVTMFQKRFKPVLKTSAMANSIIGKTYFDKKSFDKAEKYFAKAAKLEPENEDMRLNHFVNLLQQGKYDDVYPKMSAFYVETGSKLSMEELNSRLDNREIKVDMYRPDVRMFTIIRGLGL